MVKDDYLYIYLHIPRTAGTTLIKHIEARYRDDERLKLYRKELNLNKVRRVLEHADYKNIVEAYIKKIPKTKREKIKIIYGHRVPYGIHKYFKRKARYFTFFREPVARVISSYNLWTTSYENESRLGKKKLVFKNGYLVDGKKAGIDAWVKRKIEEDNIDTTGITLARFLSKLGYIGRKVNESDVGDCFKKFYFIGIVERYKKDSLFIYHKLDIKLFFKNQNVSKKYYRLGDSSRVDKMLQGLCERDSTIYKLALLWNKEFVDNNVDYGIIGTKMALKRNFTLFFTQPFFEINNMFQLMKDRIWDT